MQDKLARTRHVLHKTQSDVIQEVTAIATCYPDMIKVYVPFIPIKKLLPGWELDRKTHYHMDINTEKTSNETAEERSIRRSQQIVRDYIMCNHFDVFATITIAVDRQNIELSKNKLNIWLKNQRDRNGKFSYVIVPEYHKDGALHFHGVFKNYTGRIKRSKSSKTGRPLTSNKKPVYEFEEYKSGFTKVQYIGNTSEDHSRVGNYIRKYITKDMVSIFGKKRYWTSQGLKKPIKEYNPTWFKDLIPDYTYENEYGKIYTFTNLWSKAIPTEILNQTRFDK
jgi:hypothetical protein